MPWRLTGNSLWRAFGWRAARELAGAASWRRFVTSGFFSRIRNCCSCVFGPCMNASLTAAFQLRTVGVMRIVFAAAARYLRTAVALGFGWVLEVLLSLFRMLEIFVL